MFASLLLALGRQYDLPWVDSDFDLFFFIDIFFLNEARREQPLIIDMKVILEILLRVPRLHRYQVLPIFHLDFPRSFCTV